ncbi:MAG: hypothetical protein HOM34_00830 [Planctomycetes bacterium]|nr:hypothetical protein [Planctomycetota bacterium]MBT4027847.1 hypothetical protein [Planctomycetota bacterium]MBT4559358.1 hypothetical protein [Planctomycetota bacterium]MBT5102198.1 hypothetical protein [Planctomycetota bacterium]MBT5119249.1 hypothetical protein [Planctomycetota bacterium]
MTDWLTNSLDELPLEPVPTGFADAVRARVDRECGAKSHQKRGKLLVGVFPKVAAAFIAASLLLAVGFWAGAGAKPIYRSISGGVLGESAVLTVDELFENRVSLESWELVLDGKAEMGFADATSGSFIFEQEGDLGQ